MKLYGITVHRRIIVASLTVLIIAVLLGICCLIYQLLWPSIEKAGDAAVAEVAKHIAVPIEEPVRTRYHRVSYSTGSIDYFFFVANEEVVHSIVSQLELVENEWNPMPAYSGCPQWWEERAKQRPFIGKSYTSPRSDYTLWVFPATREFFLMDSVSWN